MVFEHEIPNGSRLYFGKLAKAKRNLENKICDILDKKGFEEILTPNFSYSQHQSIADDKKLIKFSDKQNEQVALRADSTLDVVRIISKRLGRTTSHKKWFYVQPVFSYPSNEEYQIGCEWISHDNIADIINLTADILKDLDIKPLLQVSNINIPKLVCEELDIDISLFQNGEIASLFALNCEWLSALLRVKGIEDLEKLLGIVPQSLKKELDILIEKARQIRYSNIIIAPLYYGELKYYDGIYFRVIKDNLTICKGGMYSSDGIHSLGFAIYTDSLLKILED